MRLLGKATPHGTEAYATKFNLIQYNNLQSGGLKVCQVGFGCYRIHSENEHHEAALSFALQKGINLVDTSSNYTNGRSEELIGQVLTNLSADKRLDREEVVVVSKVGYLQGQNYELARERRRQRRPFPNLVKYSQDLDHCIHPEFIEDQLNRSLDRLRLETIDVYLLHNPEYYLSWAKVANIPQPDAQQEYYRRIRLAFDYLEEEVHNGRIQWYGISSNSFPLSSEAYTFTSLEKILNIAKSISKEHHFRFIQLPLNLFETGGVTKANMPEKESTVAFANHHQINVLINRPLNAFYNDQLVRLAHVSPPNYPATVEEVSTSVDSLLNEEAEFATVWLPQLAADPETNRQLLEYLALGQMLEGKWQGFGSYQNWQDLQSRFFIPRAQSAIQYLSKIETASVEFLAWLEKYIDLYNETLGAVAAFYQELSAKEANRIQETAVAINPDWQAETLSQTAVRALRSTQGIHCTLVGMRQESYVEDMLADLANPRKPRRKPFQLEQATHPQIKFILLESFLGVSTSSQLDDLTLLGLDHNRGQKYGRFLTEPESSSALRPTTLFEPPLLSSQDAYCDCFSHDDHSCATQSKAAEWIMFHHPKSID